MVSILIAVVLIGMLAGILLHKGSCALLKQHNMFTQKDDQIKRQFVLIEVISVFVSLALYLKFDFGYAFFYYGCVCGLLMIVSIVDFRAQIIPNVLIVIGLVFSVVVAVGAAMVFVKYDYVLHWGLGILAGGVPLLLVILISRGGMGAGDMKLLAMIGGCLGIFKGWYYVFVVLVISILIGCIAGVALLTLKGKHMKSQLPFGPFISLAAFLAIVLNQQIETFLAVYYHVYL